MRQREGRFRVASLLAMLAVLAVAALVWAMSTVVAATSAPAPERTFTTAAARIGTVEQSRAIRAEARWDRTLVARNVLSGTVTSVSIDGTRAVSSGARLYSVDLKPTFVAVGLVPAFRALTDGDMGPDVRQLQQMLRSTGWLSSPIDGVFGPATRSGVERWQDHEGLEATGQIDAGAVLFVPELPATLALDETTLAPGALVSGGEPAVVEVARQPRIEAPIAADIVSEVRPGAEVRLSAETSDWQGTVQRTTIQQDGTTVAALVATDGSICGAPCPFVPSSDDQAQLEGVLVIVPPTVGVVVPTAALRTAREAQYVVAANGHRRKVSVSASALGRSVVTGIHAGTRVRISPSMGH